MNFFLKIGAGWGIRHFAPTIADKIEYFFEHYVKVWAKKLAGIDDWIEEKSGIDIFPDDMQAKYDAIVDHVTEFAEAAFTDQAKIRFVLNAILRRETSLKLEDLVAFKNKTVEEFLSSLPPDLKEIISAAKLETATAMVEGMLEKLLGQKVPKEKITASINAVVAAKNENDVKVDNAINEKSFSATWAKLTEQSQARQEHLKENK